MTDIDSANATGKTALMTAAHHNKVQAVKFLISKGADPALRDNIGRNLLDWASLCGHVDVIELLVSHLTDTDSANDTGETR